ncbi:MAG: glycerol-3-phosphate acyltransferase [Deltaproteobacteria bacterium]|nr:glycerol-3-phosphate acyltransferase [Deltaproteobacteria bacterium]
MGALAAVCIGAYLVASLNWAIVVLRALGHGDPRTRASRNPGTSNVYRLAGPLWAAVVLVLDVGRAALVAWAALRLLPLELAPLAALALVLGNRFPLWHGFRGGKGVASLLGFTAVLHPLAALFACGAWVIVSMLGRVHYVGSLAMIAALAGGAVLRCGWGYSSVLGTATALAVIVLAHSPNFREGVTGTGRDSR